MAISLRDNLFEIEDKRDIEEWIELFGKSKINDAEYLYENGFDEYFIDKVNEISSAENNIKSFELMIEEAKAGIANNKKTIIRIVDHLMLTYVNESAKEILYWGTRYGASVLKGKGIRKLSIPYTSQCKRCGLVNTGTLQINSWADASRIKHDDLSRRIEDCKCVKEETRKKDELVMRQIEEYKLRLNELKTMPYREYLKTDEWQSTRKQALKRAKFKCQLCGVSGVTLNVHHNSYKNRGQELNSDLIVLCADCHKHHHNIKDGDE